MVPCSSKFRWAIFRSCVLARSIGLMCVCGCKCVCFVVYIEACEAFWDHAYQNRDLPCVQEFHEQVQLWSILQEAWCTYVRRSSWDNLRVWWSVWLAMTVFSS